MLRELTEIELVTVSGGEDVDGNDGGGYSGGNTTSNCVEFGFSGSALCTSGDFFSIGEMTIYGGVFVGEVTGWGLFAQGSAWTTLNGEVTGYYGGGAILVGNTVVEYRGV